MADRLNIPAGSWRPRPRGSFIDPQVKRIGVVAAGLAAVLGLGFGGYSLVVHRPHTVPVIEADSRPIRVRPDNPGGMQVVGADELVGSGTGPAAMAPPPEVPAPQALRAKINAETHPAMQPVSMVSPPAEPSSPISSMPEQRAPAAARPALLAKPSSAPATGTQVQLAALESEQAAMMEWQRLSHRMPDLLSARQPAVQRAERDGKSIYRLRTGGFADIASATAFCVQVRSKGAGCSIASF